MIDKLTFLGLIGNFLYHHQGYISVKLKLKEPIQRPILNDNEDVKLPENFDKEFEESLNDIRKKCEKMNKVKLNENLLYQGEHKKVNGRILPDGKGLIYQNDEEIMMGNFKAGKLNGYGMEADDEGIIAGNFENGNLLGIGKKLLDNGNIYIGKFQGTKPSNEGKYIYPDHSFCILQKKGEKQDLLHALCYKKSNILEYNGYFDGELPHGEGIWYYDNGHIYKGRFNYGVKEGLGMIQDQNGDIVYNGKFESDNPSQKYLQYKEGIGYIALGVINMALSYKFKK